LIVTCAGCCSEGENSVNSRRDAIRLALPCRKKCIFFTITPEKSAKISHTFQKYGLWRLPICELANHNNRYSKWGYRWAIGDLSILAKFASVRRWILGTSPRQPCGCVPLRKQFFCAGALGWTPYH
jgi:hypothetical protein